MIPIKEAATAEIIDLDFPAGLPGLKVFGSADPVFIST